MILEKQLEKWIESKGHKPACVELDIPTINSKNPNEKILFYVNPQNLCWWVGLEHPNYGDPTEDFSRYIETTPSEILSDVRNLIIENMMACLK